MCQDRPNSHQPPSRHPLTLRIPVRHIAVGPSVPILLISPSTGVPMCVHRGTYLQGRILLGKVIQFQIARALPPVVPEKQRDRPRARVIGLLGP
jgi:hypothetical protein